MKNHLKLHTSEWEPLDDWLETRLILPEWGIELLKRRPDWINRMPKAIAWLMRLTGGTVQYRRAEGLGRMGFDAAFDEQMILMEWAFLKRM